MPSDTVCSNPMGLAHAYLSVALVTNASPFLHIVLSVTYIFLFLFLSHLNPGGHYKKKCIMFYLLTVSFVKEDSIMLYLCWSSVSVNGVLLSVVYLRCVFFSSRCA